LKRTARKSALGNSRLSCPVCGSNQLKIFLEIADAPVFSNILWSEKDEALNCPKADIKLAFCLKCSHVTNVSFDPSLLNYTYNYENTLEYSTKFQSYRQAIAESLIQRYELYNKCVVSIGCGRGTFLSTLCKLGKNRGIGFDPAISDHDKEDALKTKIELIQDYYSEQYADRKGDLIVCTQVLEHMFNPKGFLKMLRKAIDNRLNVGLFFEVPNAISIFQRLSIWDIVYEHYSHFTPLSLNWVLSSSGFRVCELRECFGGQFLRVNAIPGNPVAPDFEPGQVDEVSKVEECVKRFAQSFDRIVTEWKIRLQRLASEDQRVVIWGAGSKGVTFLNILRDSNIEFAVDINPRKQGKFVAGTGQKIVSPDFLRNYKPDIVITMNPLYQNEIIGYLRDFGLSSAILPSLPSRFGSPKISSN
jgi:Methyltransferase domain/C-methyltransferase C-terminal domain